MKKEVRQLREKAINALVLAIEHFNRPWDRGRTEAVLILLDHSFEMLLKAAIRERHGKIRKPREKQTIGLYFYAQAGVTLFRDIHDDVFEEKLLIRLPERVLPVSTTAPKDLTTLFDREVDEIKGLLAPGKRKKMDAVAKARSLAVLESAVKGDYEQPSDRELEKVCKRLSGGEAWTSVFPGVASINITAEHDGPSLSLRLTKNEGTPVQLLKEGEGTGAVVAVRRVNELDFYSLGAALLAKKVGLTIPKSRAVVDHLNLRDDPECFKEIAIGGITHPRYSPKAIKRIQQALERESIDDIWKAYRAKQKADK